MSEKQSVRIVLPDSGPLISMASGGVLDLLMAFKDSVRIVITDVVEYEATHRWSDLPNAQQIKDFLLVNQERIEVIRTTVGSLALGDLKRKQSLGEPAQLPGDLGELSITNFVISLRTANPGVPTLVILEDDWFVENAYAIPGNVHLVSTSSWLDGLEALHVIDSAAEVRRRIQSARPNFRAEYKLDKEAEKIQDGSTWRAAIRPGRR